MPYISVESGALSDGQKEELIKRLTEVSSEIMKVPQEDEYRILFPDRHSLTLAQSCLPEYPPLSCQRQEYSK